MHLGRCICSWKGKVGAAATDATDAVKQAVGSAQ
jgi:hypothetical protein